MVVLTLAHVEMVLIKDPMVMAVMERLIVCYFTCCVWYCFGFILFSYLPLDYTAVGGVGNGGTDAGSREDCVNKGSDSDGRGGGSDGMLLYLLRLVLFWIHSVLILIS